MPIRRSQRTEERVVELNRKVARADAVLRNLSGSEAWKIITEDLEDSRSKIDANWQSVFDEQKLKELRITKLAVQYLLNLIATYESDKFQAEQELFKIHNPNTVINKDYDTDGITEQGDEND